LENRATAAGNRRTHDVGMVRRALGFNSEGSFKQETDLRTNYLIECFRRIEYAGNRVWTRLTEQLEAAIADVQLFGSTEQAAAASVFAHGIADRDDNASTGPLLQMLRDELRHELDLPLSTCPCFI